jgi:hypothetical protein
MCDKNHPSMGFPFYDKSTYISRSNGFQLVKLSEKKTWDLYQDYIASILENGVVCYNCKYESSKYRLIGLVGLVEENKFRSCNYKSFYSLLIKRYDSRDYYVYAVECLVNYNTDGSSGHECSHKFAYEASSLDQLTSDLVDKDVIKYLKSCSDYWKNKL